MAERQLISSGSPFEPAIGFSRAVRVGNHVWVAGTAPIWPDGKTTSDDPEAQATRCLEIIVASLDEAGAKPEHVVRTRQYLTDAADGEAVGRAHGKVFGSIRPASTQVVVAALLRSEWKVEIEAEAVIS